ELQELAGHRARQAVDPGDTVTGGEHRAGFGDRDLLVVVLDLLADDVADLCGADIHGRSLQLLREVVAQVAELGAQAAVVHGVAEPGDYTAEQRRVFFTRDGDLLARELLERGRDLQNL